MFIPGASSVFYGLAQGEGITNRSEVLEVGACRLQYPDSHVGGGVLTILKSIYSSRPLLDMRRFGAPRLNHDRTSQASVSHHTCLHR